MSKSHHVPKKFCYNRAAYRDPRWERAVKVYTVNQESRYLLIQGVPATRVRKELVERCTVYGVVEDHRVLDEYPHEEFTEVHWIKFARLASARFAKRKLDDISFFGGVLHVCYAPEYESVGDTRDKLNERKRTASRKCREYERDGEVNRANEGAEKWTTNAVALNNLDMFSLPKPLVEGAPEYSTFKDSLNSHFFDRKQSSNTNATKGRFSASSSQSCTSKLLSRLTESLRTENQGHCQVNCASSKPSTTLPRIPTKNATLPVELQNLSAAEVYPAYYKEKYSNTQPMCEHFQSHSEVKTGLKTTVQEYLGSPSEDAVQIEEQTKDKNGIFISRKRKCINWNVPLSKVMSVTTKSSSTGEENSSHSYSQEPGAWDPRKEGWQTKNNPEEDDDELSSTVNGIREKLYKSAEPSSKTVDLIYQKTDPLQGSGAQLVPRVVTAKRKNDGRKRI